jgi:Cytochrome c
MPALRRQCWKMARSNWPILDGVLVAAGIIALVSSARAQNFDAGFQAGQAEYLPNCAKCHGADGRGAGPHSAALKKRPADLTLLAKLNHGVFPVSEVYRLVDGRGSERKHLSDEMPLWECRQSSPRPPPLDHRRRRSVGVSRRPSPDADLEAFMNLTCDLMSGE